MNVIKRRYVDIGNHFR